MLDKTNPDRIAMNDEHTVPLFGGEITVGLVSYELLDAQVREDTVTLKQVERMLQKKTLSTHDKTTFTNG